MLVTWIDFIYQENKASMNKKKEQRLGVSEKGLNKKG